MVPKVHYILRLWAEKRALFNRKLKMVEFGNLDDSKAYGSRICMIWKYSNGNLVMHFHKTVYIS